MTEPSTPLAASDRLSVVVVDDEPDVAAYLAAVLERRGHLVSTAASVAEGFELTRKLHPDAVCVDIVMPEASGITLLKRIRADSEVAGTPVVLISALKREMAASLGLDAQPPLQPDEFVEKPPNAERFVAVVERVALARRRSA